VEIVSQNITKKEKLYANKFLWFKKRTFFWYWGLNSGPILSTTPPTLFSDGFFF
jgi:hypothetical protein